jgi:hypothetical protein
VSTPSFIHAFADELVKIAGSQEDSLGDVVGAEALGPLSSAVKGYRHRGLGGALRAGGAYVLGGGAGALLGGLAAKGLKYVAGRDPGIGPVRASTVLPSVGALILGLKAEKMATK